MELAEALELVARFSRTRNYPKDEAGVVYLAEGLIRAADQTGVLGSAIVFRCAAESDWCPSDADLLTIAREIRDEMKRESDAKINVTAEWKKKYGQPEEFKWDQIDTSRVKRVKDRERELLAKIKAKFPKDVTWAQMAQAAAEFGYYEYAEAWHAAQAGNKRITAEQWKSRIEGKA